MSLRRRLVYWLIALTILALGAAGGAAHQVRRALDRPYLAAPGGAVEITIEPGSPARSILERLEREGVVSSALLARLYLVHRLGDPALRAGEYRFDETASIPEVLDRLIRGDVVTYRVTVVEGLTLEETAEHLATSGFGELHALLAAMSDPAPIADLDADATDLEGYLFPDTYEFLGGTPEISIVGAMVTNFRRRVEALGWYDGDATQGIGSGGRAVADLRERVTLASIVEKESRVDEERPLVAAVYSNRLRIGMGLYADPTIIYALKKLGRWDGNLRRPDLKLDSPYNTYLYPGLPPGPICSPGLASLAAAASPADVPYLYFVSRNDGTHVFSRTLAEHNRNVAEWQKRYWRERWAEERRRPQGDGP